MMRATVAPIDLNAVERKKDGTVDERFLRRAKHLAALETFLREPQSVDDCARLLGVGSRAIYFLLDALEERGHVVARLGPKTSGRYVLMS
jgi:predicted ArsR family transcriptional regulator